MSFLPPEAAKMLRLDQKPDGEHILFKLIAIPGQYILHTCRNQEEVFRGTSTAQLAKAFGALTVDSGWLPPGICRWGQQATGDWMVRWYPPGRYVLQFGNLEDKASSLLAVPLPAMIFAGIGATYYVWAVKEQIFSPQALLHAVPLPNIYSDGRICYGSNVPPAVSAEQWQTVETAWQLFITTPFLADLAAQKSQARPDDVREFLAQIAKKDRPTYPLEDLVPYNQQTLTVERAIHVLLGTK